MKSSRFSWKLKLIVGKAFDNDNNNKKIFNCNINSQC